MNDIKQLALELAIEAELQFFFDEDGNRDNNAAVLVYAASVIENYLNGTPQEWDDEDDNETTDDNRKDN